VSWSGGVLGTLGPVSRADRGRAYAADRPTPACGPRTARPKAVCWSPVNDLQPSVAHSADLAGLHATAPALLLELQSLLGALSTTATEITDRGRRPFRPNASWSGRLGELAYRVYLLADQTGVELDAEIRTAAEAIEKGAAELVADGGWPFDHD
jgi:hypothetical protein